MQLRNIDVEDRQDGERVGLMKVNDNLLRKGFDDGIGIPQNSLNIALIFDNPYGATRCEFFVHL